MKGIFNLVPPQKTFIKKKINQSTLVNLKHPNIEKLRNNRITDFADYFEVVIKLKIPLLVAFTTFDDIKNTKWGTLYSDPSKHVQTKKSRQLRFFI